MSVHTDAYVYFFHTTVFFLCPAATFPPMAGVCRTERISATATHSSWSPPYQQPQVDFIAQKQPRHAMHYMLVGPLYRFFAA